MPDQGTNWKSTFGKHRWPLLAAVLVAAVLMTLGLRWWRGAEVATDTVVRRDFVQTVVASGRVETAHRVDIGAQITGTVLNVPVTEGQVVKAGDLLVELGSAELRATQRQATVAVSQALAHLRQMSEVQAPVARQALRQAQASLDQARSVQARNQELLRRGFIGQAALDESNKTVELADAQLRSARRQLDAARPAGSDRAVADATLEGALAGEQAAQARGRYALLRAPVDGTLIARDVEVGDVVQPGKVLLTLSPSGRMQLVVDIDEKNLHLLALGQSALVSADAYPQERIAAHIAFINPGINAQTGSVEVKLDVPTPPAPWRQDMTVSVDIEVARRPQALLVPTGALRDADGPTPWVMRLEGRHAVRRAVQLGLRSAGHAELLSGLSEGDVLVPAASAVTAGARIHALPPIASAPAAPAAAVTADATPGAAAPR